METKVFELLEQLMTENPFCDVSFVGNSFGSGLATISAINCAEKYPMMTVSCHSFGCPKLGKRYFRDRAHSLPNLRIFRIELDLESCNNVPTSTFQHLGHVIFISNTKDRVSSSKKSHQENEQVSVKAFKFGKNGTYKTKVKKSHGKSHTKMCSYVYAIESFTHRGCQWVEKFVGEDGEGILGSIDKEERLIV